MKGEKRARKRAQERQQVEKVIRLQWDESFVSRGCWHGSARVIPPRVNLSPVSLDVKLVVQGCRKATGRTVRGLSFVDRFNELLLPIISS